VLPHTALSNTVECKIVLQYRQVCVCVCVCM